jgi:glycine cleavage system H protein
VARFNTDALATQPVRVRLPLQRIRGRRPASFGTAGWRARDSDGISERPPLSKEHEWACPEPDGRVRVGITDFAQDALGDVVYVNLPDLGTDVAAGASLGEVESTKSVSDVYAPVSGKVVERNSSLHETPELVNEQPYGDGWLVVIEPTDPNEIERLLDAEAYRAHTGQG